MDFIRYTMPSPHIFGKILYGWSYQIRDKTSIIVHIESAIQDQSMIWKILDEASAESNIDKILNEALAELNNSKMT